MDFAPIGITLKDGRNAVLRPPRAEDAPAMIDHARTVGGETEFLNRTPAECAGMTPETEQRKLLAVLADPDSALFVCEVDGMIAGTCQLQFSVRERTRHRARVAIGLKKAYWGLGIGSAMFRAMETEARRRPGVLLMELDYVDGNDRARALYEKAGFRVVGVIPDRYILSGGLAAEVSMQKRL